MLSGKVDRDYPVGAEVARLNKLKRGDADLHYLKAEA